MSLSKSSKASNLLIVQGGGPTVVFNASLAAIIASAQRSDSFEKLYGARFGVQGLLAGDVVDITATTQPELEKLRNTPGAALGSSRYSPTEEDMEALLDSLERLEIGALLFMGGNGTMRGAKIVSDRCRERGLDVRVVGVPKTVDNDLSTTDRAPGFASAARYAASATRELAADVRSLRQPVSILETLGRNVGWIAGATALARQNAGGDDAPQIICIPEVPFVEDEFLGRVDDIVRRIGWAVVVVAEGIRHADQSLVFHTTSAEQADPMKRPMTGGVARHLAGVIGNRLGMRCRSEIPGLLGRTAMHYVSPRDLEDAYAVGHRGVAALIAGERDVMVSLEPLRDEVSRTSLLPLSKACGAERTIPAHWLRDGAIPVSDDFLDYIRPLVGPLDEQLTQLGVPVRQQRQDKQ